MSKFKDELKNNNFVCSECIKCKHLVWPPSEFCNKCLGDVVWRSVSRNATLVEFSNKDGTCFCVAEFEDGIRVFGTIPGNHILSPGQHLVLEHCTYEETPKFIFQAS
jgi:uncharacterized OB-fold protein